MLPLMPGLSCARFVTACNCHGQAESCHYNAMTALLGRSLNVNGVREGGGVCDDCQRNTTGTQHHR